MLCEKATCRLTFLKDSAIIKKDLTDISLDNTTYEKIKEAVEIEKKDGWAFDHMEFFREGMTGLTT